MQGAHTLPSSSPLAEPNGLELPPPSLARPCLLASQDVRRSTGSIIVTVGMGDVQGMGRAIHTNYATRFRCDALKLAMIKNRHLAAKLFGGDVYDSVCLYEPRT